MEEQAASGTEMSFEMGTLGLKYHVLHFSFHPLPLSEFIVFTFFLMLKRSWDWISSMQWRGLCNEICNHKMGIFTF